MSENPMEIFGSQGPEVANAVNDLIKSLVASKRLDQKTKRRIYIAMKALMGDKMALKAHVPIGKKAGATKRKWLMQS